ncbi:MAG: putative P-type ATPase [Streblomastix strix]|uniref:Putative P-type ATPase n=1 Tax=Streblomastix strix TaxID=222440 RepID=A0A5J4X3X8_9EUKA|nr:MAG: putative P-type ATPase [Streblomastix strix]
MIRSKDVQPGDVFEVSEKQTIACDELLLSGKCIMDESTLIGESAAVIQTGIPVIQILNQYTLELIGKEYNKQKAEYALSVLQGTITETEILGMDRDKQPIIFGGTRVVRARDTTSGCGIDVPLYVALRTGFSTAKRQLVRSILFPKPQIRFNWWIYGESIDQIILRALDLITIAIFNVSPERINVAGKVKVVCFDKTGTITEEDLGVRDVKGVRDVRRQLNVQQSKVDLNPKLNPNKNQNPNNDSIPQIKSMRTDIKQEIVTVTEFAALQRSLDEMMYIFDLGDSEHGIWMSRSEWIGEIESERKISYGGASCDKRSIYTVNTTDVSS